MNLICTNPTQSFVNNNKEAGQYSLRVLGSISDEELRRPFHGLVINFLVNLFLRG